MPLQNIPIEAPGGFAPVAAIGLDDGSGNVALVSAVAPLPTVALVPPAPAALTGSTATSMLAGPFIPAPLAPVYLTLSGEWQGTARVMRSTDSGVTLHPLTLGGVAWAEFTGNACEPVWIESDGSAALFLELVPTSGAVTYRVSQ